MEGEGRTQASAMVGEEKGLELPSATSGEREEVKSKKDRSWQETERKMASRGGGETDPKKKGKLIVFQRRGKGRGWDSVTQSGKWGFMRKGGSYCEQKGAGRGLRADRKKKN